MTEQSVPVIDIAPFLKGERALVVEQVRAACEGVGFFTIVGHGVEPAIINNLRNNARGFSRVRPTKKILTPCRLIPATRISRHRR